ncbi:hypothetical protein VNO77_33942 [Canavalia gladiata]|uniref:Uncharacterized protein n=1 Tax=Canavalia gladiata TaxID=3824 RepID=A0AAN9PY53_CANGL
MEEKTDFPTRFWIKKSLFWWLLIEENRGNCAILVHHIVIAFITASYSLLIISVAVACCVIHAKIWNMLESVRKHDSVMAPTILTQPKSFSFSLNNILPSNSAEHLVQSLKNLAKYNTRFLRINIPDVYQYPLAAKPNIERLLLRSKPDQKVRLELDIDQIKENCQNRSISAPKSPKTPGQQQHRPAPHQTVTSRITGVSQPVKPSLSIHKIHPSTEI